MNPFELMALETRLATIAKPLPIRGLPMARHMREQARAASVTRKHFTLRVVAVALASALFVLILF